MTPLNLNELLAKIATQYPATQPTPQTSPTKYAGPLALKESLESDAAYVAYMEALGILYGLKDLPPNNLKWGDVQGLNQQAITRSFISPPTFMANPGFDHPKLAISLIPRSKGKNVSGLDSYHAPILLRDVDRWQFAKNRLGNYQINRLSGVEPGREMLPKASSFKSFADVNEELNIKDSTPVVECVALVPIAPNGEFELEFTPQLRFDTGDHTSYTVSIVKEDGFSVFSKVHQGLGTVIDLSDVDHTNRTFNFTAGFVPDLSKIEQLLTPTSRGHFIIIGTPIEPPETQINFNTPYSGLDGGYGGGRGYDSPMKSFGNGASFGDISIKRGTQTGAGTLFTGELANSRKGNTTIFHVKLIGVKPDDAAKLDASSLDAFNGAIGAYQQN